MENLAPAIRRALDEGVTKVLQSETKEYSDDNTYHWDVSDQRLLLNVAGAIEHMTSLSVTQLELMTR